MYIPILLPPSLSSFPMTLVMAGRPPQSSHILPTATDLNWNLPFPGGSVVSTAWVRLSTQRRRSTFAGHDEVAKVPRLWTASLASSIESPQMMGFTGGREGGRKTKIFRVRIRVIYGGRGRYTHRCPAKYRFFDIPDILDTPANIADRRWHSIAPNLSRLSYTSTDFF